MSLAEILTADALAKACIGLILLLLPGPTARLAGLWRGDVAFWPRMAGALLLGIALAIVLQFYIPAKGGLGAAGTIAINMTGAVALLSALSMGAGAPTRRGRAVLWSMFALLVVVSLAEIAAAR